MIASALPVGCGDDGATATGIGTTAGDTSDATTRTHGDTDHTTALDTSGRSETTLGSTSSEDTTGDDDATSTGSTGSTGSTSTGSTGDATTTEAMPVPCPAGDLGMTVPAAVAGSTLHQADELGGSCGGAGAPDIAYLFTAPDDNSYSFDTFGSSLDTVLYVLDGVCGGAELACDDDAIAPQSVVSVPLAQGQTVTIVVDGFALVGGPFELAVSEGQIACPRMDLSSTVPQTVTDNTGIASDAFDGSCGFLAAPDFAYTFTAPADGTYTFDTFGATFDTVLYVLDGMCSGTELACSDNAPNNGQASGVAVALLAGQTVTVVVDGFFGSAGWFDLHIGQLGGPCPGGDLGAAVPVMQIGSTALEPNTIMASCGGLASPDATWLWTAPADGFYRFETAGSGFDTVLVLRDGGCDGPELACNDDVSPMDATSGISAELSAGQTVMVGVDGNADAGDYALSIDAATCPAVDLGTTLPAAQLGSTVGEANLLDGTCGGTGAPDATFLWTAPHDGTFVFDTTGSSFDTKLYLLDGASCGAPVLACDDDGGFGTQSLITADLTQGQSVVVVVDGAQTDAGDYVLAIDEQTPMCPDADIGSAVPYTHMGTTSGDPNEVDGSCTGGAGPDVGLTWTASAAGTYVIDTFGSSFDTVLTVYDGAACEGDELACNDDAGALQSEVMLTLSAGQTITIVVDGFGGASSGDYVLNIATL